MGGGIQVRPIEESDRAWVAGCLASRWGGDVVVAHGTIYQPARLPGFIAWSGTERTGIVTYHLEDSACEIVTLDSFRSGEGIGTALVDAVIEVARSACARRVWLITTNDNLRGLRFYQRRGFHLTALHPDAVTTARRIKPQIPLTGEHGIPLRDELELSMELEDV